LTGTLAVNTGTGDTSYPAANLDNNMPSKPAKLTGTTGSWTRNLGSAMRADICAVFHHNFQTALDVKLQGHTSNSWGAPDVNLSFSIPAAHVDGFTKNVWLDIESLVPTAGNRTKQWWRLLINAANATPVAVGEWAMYSSQRNFGIRNIKWGSTRRLYRPSIVHETEYMLRRSYDIGTTIRGCQVELEATDTVRDDVEALVRAAQGEVLPITMLGHKDYDEPWFATLIGNQLEWTREHRNYNPLTLEFRELSRGLIY
jgi:hypothetical protein